MGGISKEQEQRARRTIEYKTREKVEWRKKSEKIARNLLGKKAIIEPWEEEEEGAKKKIIKKRP